MSYSESYPEAELENLMGRAINGYGEVIDGGTALSGVSTYRLPGGQAQNRQTAKKNEKTELLETGLKVIDLLCPLQRGVTLTIYSEYGLGKLVLLGELAYRLAQKYQGVMVYTAQESRQYELKELISGIRELGTLDKTVLVVAPALASKEERRKTALLALGLTQKFGESAGREVMLHLDERLAQPGEIGIEPGQPYFSGNSSPVCLVSAAGTKPRVQSSDSTVEDRWVFEQELAREKLYPALSRLLSTSSLLHPEVVGSEHFEVASRVRQLLEEYYRLKASDPTALTHEQQTIVTRATRLERFLSQPLYVAESYSGLPGEYVGLKETIKGCSDLLEGKHDDLPQEAFYMVGSIEQAIEKAKRL